MPLIVNFLLIISVLTLVYTRFEKEVSEWIIRTKGFNFLLEKKPVGASAKKRIISYLVILGVLGIASIFAPKKGDHAIPDNSNNSFYQYFVVYLMFQQFLSLIITKAKNLVLRKKESEITRLKDLKLKAELASLQAKINPHFLYNSLNSIASLAHEDANKVEHMAISLSKFYRQSINPNDNSYSTIKEEMEMVKSYLDIEKIRFGDKLEFSINIDADENYLIPRFLIQPLVENAIKHGISKITTKGIISINIQEKNKELEISVHDNGPDFPTDLMTGYGIQSTHEKLNLLFPDAHEVQIINGENKQVKIILKKLIKDEPKV